MTLSQNAKDIGTVFTELRGKGIGRLLGTALWVKSPVAIYYSAEHPRRPCAGARIAVPQLPQRLLPDHARPGAAIRHDQLLPGRRGPTAEEPAGMLSCRPRGHSPKEAENLSLRGEGRRGAGGRRSGICDDRCDLRVNNQLEKLFGDGKTAGVKQVGQGKAILLAEQLDDYTKARLQSAAPEIRKQMLDTFQQNHVQPTIPIKVGDAPLGQAETVVMQMAKSPVPGRCWRS